MNPFVFYFKYSFPDLFLICLEGSVIFLKKGLFYLFERWMEKDLSTPGSFLKWLQNDQDLGQAAAWSLDLWVAEAKLLRPSFPAFPGVLAGKFDRRWSS